MNPLRHSLCPHSQIHLRPLAAPSVRVSLQQASPGHERGNERGGRERELICGSTVTRREHTGGPKRNPRGRKTFPKERRRQEQMNEEEEGAPCPCPSFMERGSVLRSAPFRAPPPFWEPPKKGRSSLPSASHRASTNRGRAAPPRLCHTPRRKQVGKIRAPLGTPVVSFRVRRCCEPWIEMDLSLGTMGPVL